MKHFIFSTLSKVNKAVLPKMWPTADLANLSNTQKAVFGWKRWVTYKLLEEKEKQSNSK